MELFVFIVSYCLTVYFYYLIRLDFAMVFGPIILVALGFQSYWIYLSDGKIQFDYLWAFSPLISGLGFLLVLRVFALILDFGSIIKRKYC